MKIKEKLQSNLPTPQILAGLILAIIILGYGIYRTHDLIFGPLLIVNSPVDGEILNDSLISVKGEARRITKIFINDQQIFTQKDGHFNIPLLLGYGYNIIEVKTQDQFGRQEIKTMRVILN